MRAAVTTLRLLGIEEGSEGSGARADIRVLALPSLLPSHRALLEKMGD